MPLLEVVGMTPTVKNFTVATAFVRNKQAPTFREVLQQIKQLYFLSAVSTRNEQDLNAHEPCIITTNRESGLMHVIDEDTRNWGCHPCSQEKDMDSEMRNLSFLLDQISTGPISKVREMRRRPSWAPRGKGREHPSTSSTFPFSDTFPSFVNPFMENWKNMEGDGNYEHQWLEVRKQMCFKLEHMTNMYVSLFESVEWYYELIQRTQWWEGYAPPAHWLDTPDFLYFISNAFNLCLVLIARIGSTSVLSLYSQMNQTGGMIMDAYYPLYICNSNIIVLIESVVGQSLILAGLHIGARDMLEHIHQEIPFMLSIGCYCN
ncbi:hypothetical protein M9H77_06351 [Catharanthus roseus]|uniref:Uncharacterized protein n=1 Tax=Catharanthus roseus TaxID=4058 RepID=A0ACC0BS21_CATRO|nr:hypothetical protein M9H77_06351 [Catharanthus roseus]